MSAVPPTRPRGRPPGRAAGTTRPDTVSALERGVAILRCFEEAAPLRTYAELEQITGIPRPTIVRLVATLQAQGLIRPAPGGEGFMLGPGVIALARVFLNGLDVRATARPLMQAMADTLGGSVYLAVRDGLEMVLIEVCRARVLALAPRLDVGSRVPLARSALGRAYLLGAPPALREQLLESLALMRGSDWSEPRDAMQAMLARSQAQGFCDSIGEFHRDINSVAVPIADATDDVLALNFGGAAYDFPAERLLQDVGPQLRELGQQVAQAIGGSLAVGEGVPLRN